MTWLVLRHGERTDAVFGANWPDRVFVRRTKDAAQAGAAGWWEWAYKRTSSELPRNIPWRLPLRAPQDYALDPPLTERGVTQANRVGATIARALSKTNAPTVFMLISPALRSVQTAQRIFIALKHAQVRVKLVQVDERLLEAASPAAHGVWLSDARLKRLELLPKKATARFQVQLRPKEAKQRLSERAAYARHASLAQEWASVASEPATYVICVAHAYTARVLSRQLAAPSVPADIGYCATTRFEAAVSPVGAWIASAFSPGHASS